MSSSPSISNAFIGELLVDRGLITHAQLDEALSMQERSGELLGEIVVAHFGVSRVELADALADQWERLEQPSSSGTEPRIEAPLPASAAPPVPAAKVERRPIGEIFVEHGMITESQLESALERQRVTGDRLGEVLVADGAITRLELADALAEQWSNLEKLRPPEPKPVVPWQYQAGNEPPPQSQPQPHPGDAPSVDAEVVEELRAGLARLRERLDALPDADALSARIVALETTRPAGISAEALDERLGAVTADLASGIDAAIAPVREAAAALEARLDAVGVDVPSRAELEELRRALATLPRLDANVEEALAALTQGQSGLADRIAALPVVDVSGLEARLHQLETAPKPLDDDLLADLFGRVEALGDRLGGLASEEWVGSIERQLAEQREATSGATAALEGAVANLAHRLEVALAEIQSGPDPSEGVRSELASLAARVEGLAGQLAEAPTGFDPAQLQGIVSASEETTGALRAALEELRGRVEHADAHVRHELDELRARPERDEEAWARLGELGSRLDGLALSTEHAHPDVSDRVEELRTRLDALVVPPDLRPELAALTARLDEIWETVRAAEETASSLRHEFASRIDQPATAAPDVELVLDELRGRLEGALAGVADIGSRLQGLAGQVVQRGTELQHDLEALRAELSAVTSRVDAHHEAPSLDVEPALVDVRARLDALDERVAALDVAPHDPELHGQLAELHGRVVSLAAGGDQLGHDLEAVRGWVSELDVRTGSVPTSLDEIHARLNGLAHELHELRSATSDAQGAWGSGVERHELDDVNARLSGLAHELDELRSASPDDVGRHELDDVNARLAATSERLEALPHELHELRSRLDALPGREELETRLAALHGTIEEREDALSPPVLDELRARLEANEAALEAVGRSNHVEHELRARLEAVEAHVAALGARESEVDARLGAADAATIAVADALGRRTEELAADLSGRVEELRTQVDHGLGRLQHRLDEAAASRVDDDGRAALVDERLEGLAHRLAALEGRLGDTPVEELRSTVAALVPRFDAFHGELEARERATERALRKGLAELGERLVAGEREYREAGSRLRRSIDRLGAAVVEADARIADLPLDAPSDGHVAFVPTPEGYRLRVFDGPAPEVGTVLELDEVVGPLRVSRLARSPLPLDRRACAFLERLG